MSTTTRSSSAPAAPPVQDVTAAVHALTAERIPGLLDGGAELRLDDAFASCSRTQLDAASWVDFVPGWIQSPDELLEQIARSAPWEQRWRQMYGEVFKEPRFTAELNPITQAPVPFLATVTRALKARYGIDYDSVWINFYADETQSTGWHADRPANRPPEAIVPVLSLGAPRRFSIKPRSGGRAVAFTPGAGDLIVMGGRAQRDWLHAAPKQTTPAGPRISLNFGSSEQNQGRRLQSP